MVSGRTSLPSLPNTRKLTIVAQDPSVRIGGRILTAEIEIPAEELLPGPCGYRINVIDYDSTNNVLYDAAELELRDGNYLDPFSKKPRRSGKSDVAAAFNNALLEDPKFHAQNVYRIGPDGFILHETVAEYVQILTLNVDELKAAIDIDPPPEMPGWLRVEIFGGGALIFNEYGQLKYQIGNRLENAKRQTARLQYLWDSGFYDRSSKENSHFAEAHLARATA